LSQQTKEIIALHRHARQFRLRRSQLGLQIGDRFFLTRFWGTKNSEFLIPYYSLVGKPWHPLAPGAGLDRQTPDHVYFKRLPQIAAG
jgi:hypothetical protein